MTKKVMVLMGGFSSEREVSLQSGKSIAAALKNKDYEVHTHDLTDTQNQSYLKYPRFPLTL